MLRPYQREANEAIECAIGDRKRRMLVAMATGTGKTFVMVNQVYRLLKSGLAKRVLFLVDRRVLARQAVQAFAAFEPEPGRKFHKLYPLYSQRFRRDDDLDDSRFDPEVLPGSYLTDPGPGHTFVYVCTIQRMAINLFGRSAQFEGDEEELDEDADRLDIPIHAFDVIVADECHRGYTTAELSLWRNTLDHFDAIKIGLTATPAYHTTAYFNDIVYRYEYERAVREGYLVDYDVVAIRSNVRMQGVFLKEGEQVALIDPETGARQLDLLEDERVYDASEVERQVTAPDSNRKILEEVRKYAEEHERRYGRFPKTLIFAVNDLPHVSHADQLVTIAREVFGRGEAFAQKITGRVDRPLQRIKEFRNLDSPGIVVSVDLMSTGVDIRDLEFIVFLRPVKSRILFEQMLGRGTRKGDRFPDKSHFVVFDCFDGTLLAYFRQTTGMTVEAPDRPSRTIQEIIEDIWQNRDRAYNVRCLVKRLQRISKEMSGDARQDFAVFVPDGDLGRFARELPRLINEDFSPTMSLIRDPAFQDLLVNFKRPQRIFVRADQATDEVTSEWRVVGADGAEYKPEDYLEAFSLWVLENADQVDAIAILLRRPRDWGTDALAELRQRLRSAPQRFTEEHLQKAHEVQYRKALVDIISMVKHAAREEEPLFTAEERIRQAVTRITEGRDFTFEQIEWIERIRDHLIHNLSISRADFSRVPVLERAGGWKRADREFGGKLEDLLREINEAVAA
jgi:type I restriction enzyme R subunit